MKIKPLPEEVIAKIAAGEVVERPASVIKELIENSLDAKASFIQIEVENGGKRYISVKDDGEGIEKDDIINAVKKHHTSKIRTLEDLYQALTFGFRGEALYSISSVSKFRITSRTKSQLTASQLYIEGGKVISLTEAGAPIGTNIEVIDLFYNLPARQKFLKSENTENFHNVAVFLSYALSNPSVYFKFISNKNTVYNLYPSTIEERLKQVFNKDFSKIEYEGFAGKVKGYISFQKNRLNFIYVNNRPVKNQLISKVLKEFLGEAGFVIFLEIPPYTYDINAHPSKTYIKFQNENFIINLVKSALDNSLSKKQTLSYQLSQPVASYIVDSKFEVLGVVEDTFIVLYWKGDIYFVDAHVAGERVMYEIFLRKLTNRQFYPSDVLSSPLSLDISAKEKERFYTIKQLLEYTGYRFIVKDKLYITAIPQGMDTGKAILAIKELLLMDLKNPQEEVSSKISCRISFMAGDKIQYQEAIKLLEEWIKTDNPHLCPHGRPIYYKISLDQIKQFVGRK